MPLSLHAALIPGWLQILASTRALVDKAEAHCTATGIDPQTLIGARLIDDMLPFAYQIKSCAVHSQGAIEGVRKGQFAPDMADPPHGFAGLAERLDAASLFLAGIDPAELDDLAGRDMMFEIPGRIRYDFTGADFLLGFSQPNFFFHATTAYNILRANGVRIGKRDYIGAMPLKG